MDVGDDRNPHRRAATLAALGLFGAAWAAAAWLLSRTRVPELELPAVDPASLLPPAALERIEAYHGVSRWLWVASAVLELGALGLLAWRARPLARRATRVARGPARTGALLGTGAAACVWLATLPAAGAALWWRRRYGLSEQAVAGWLRDEAVSLGVLAVAVALLAGGAVWLAGRLGRRWWIAGAVATAVLGLAVALAQPVVIEPLFHRLGPLADRALAAEVEELGRRLGVDVGEVEVADASRRTTAANARVIGLGPSRTVVLHDTLLDGRFERAEVLTVAAHELAHVARAHVWKAVAWFALLAVPSLVAIALAAERRGGLRDPALVPLALLLAYLCFLATLPVQSVVSRRYEAEADWLALTATRDPEAAIAVARRFALTGLADPTPPGWARILLGTHPTVLERAGMAEAFASR